MKKSKPTAKDKHYAKIMAYYADPEHDLIPRSEWAVTILGLAGRTSLWNIFTPDEMHEMECDILARKRKTYMPKIAEVDKAMLKKAKAGSTKAAKLIYQRFEDWAPRVRREISGPDGSPVKVVGLTEYLDEIDGSSRGLPADNPQEEEEL